MNVNVLEKILISDNQYWVVRKELHHHNGNKIDPSIILIAIPWKIKQGLKSKDIKLDDLKNLNSIEIMGNVFLNESFAPFQSGQNLNDVTECFPVKCNVKDFLRKALDINSSSIWDYQKLMDAIFEEEEK